MSYLKLEHRALTNERWLSVSAAAFVVHVWALDYCNEQATDGAISLAMSRRLVCPVPPTDLEAAWAELVNAGIWQEQHAGVLRCPGFLSYGIAADEQQATREKWAHDKRRRRLHDVGNHMLCTPRSCRVAAASCPPVDSTEDSTEEKWTTRPDQTRPDQTRPERSSGSGSGAVAHAAPAAAGPRSAVSDAVERLGMQPHEYDGECCPLPQENPIHRGSA